MTHIQQRSFRTSYDRSLLSERQLAGWGESTLLLFGISQWEAEARGLFLITGGATVHVKLNCNNEVNGKIIQTYR